MTPDERDDYALFLEILKSRHLIQDYMLSEDGTKLGIQPIAPLDYVAIDLAVKDDYENICLN